MRDSAQVSTLFSKLYISDQARQIFEEHTRMYNNGECKRTPPTYGHLEQGFWGVHALELVNREPLEQEDLLRIWGYAKLAILAAGSEVREAKRSRTG